MHTAAYIHSHVDSFFGCCPTASGAPNSQWHSPQPGPAANSEGDGTEEGEDSGFWSFRYRLQGNLLIAVPECPVPLQVSG